MRFHDPAPSGHSKKPLNYFSRRMQWQLLMLVFSLMLVLVLMERARDPRMYAWMWGNQQSKGESYEIKLTPRTKSAETPKSDKSDKSSPPTEDERRWQVAVHDAWHYVLPQLPMNDVNLLADALMAARHGVQLDSKQGNDLSDIVDAMDAAWQQYLTQAHNDLASTSNDDTNATWQAALIRLGTYWNDTVQPGLRDLAAGQSSALNDFKELQSALDEVTLEAVEDNTVFHSSEHVAWFRIFEKLKSRETEHREQPAAASYLQLLRQPNVYRGKLLRVRGSVREARWVAARKNSVGVDRYAVLWIKPDEANAPLVVYCLQLPDKFPKIADARRGEPPTKLDQRVSIDGYFFKRHAYRAIGGVEVAPLLIADAPVMTGNPQTLAATQVSTNPALLIVAACTIALMVAAVIYSLSPKRNREPLPDRLDLGSKFPADLK